MSAAPPTSELLPDWLLAACLYSLETGDVFWHRPSDPATDPYHPLRLAATQLRPTSYPPRPSLPASNINPLTTSGEAAAALVQVLKEAPNRNGPEWNDATPGIVVSYNGEDADYDYDWSMEYRKRVERALGDVALADSDEVYNLARWTVYDTFSACVWGVEHFVDCNTLVWVDHAKDWLSDELKERLKSEATQRKECAAALSR